MQLAHDVKDLPHEDGGEAHGRFVQHEQLGRGDERAAHGQHLLLAAGQGPGDLVAALLEAREAGKHILHARLRCLARGVSAHLQVFLHRHGEEDAPALRHMREPAPDEAVGLLVADLLIQKPDAPGARPEQAGNGL